MSVVGDLFFWNLPFAWLLHQCPQCKTHVERKDLSNLCVQCIVCTDEQKKPYQFCWQCQRKWKGPGPRSNRCDNTGCTNRDLQLLQTCQTVSLPDVEGVTSCPSVRACPVCGTKVEHNQMNCKNVICPRCHMEFCFVCLKLKRECCQTSSPYRICPSGVAPRQTSIPVWQKKMKEWILFICIPYLITLHLFNGFVLSYLPQCLQSFDGILC